MCERNQEQDELRARFTKWMEVTLYRARLRYLRKESQKAGTVPLDEIKDWYSLTESSDQDPFDFEQEQLAEAFARLSPEKQTILSMLFADEMTPAEVARELGYPPQKVYDQRYQAIKALRACLQNGGVEDDR